VGRAWWSSIFDATLGFPGEGPRAEWLHLASQVLNGGAVFEGQPWIPEALSSDGIHDLLLGIALQGNSIRPIAARVQSRPDRVAALLGEDNLTTTQAFRGCAYNFGQRPYQIRRPRPIRLAADSLRAASAEIDRLREVCGAVESAPAHDRDRALTSWASAWELHPLPLGMWPAEKRVPILASRDDRRRYDDACMASQAARRAAGRPFRDFESTVFVVPKKDGRFRLCTDYRALKEFQRKVPFKMDTLQTVAESIQPNDFGMLVDLTDCYLTMGLHPSHRKY
jgi:hypothetical protein